MSGTKQKSLFSALVPKPRGGLRLVAVSERIEMITANGPSPTDVYLQEEFNNLSKYAEKQTEK
jgi:hypothetical protein